MGRKKKCTLQKLLEVEVAANELLSYLSFEDLKSFSEASTSCLNVVRENFRFKKLAKLLISREQIKKNYQTTTMVPLEILRETKFAWRNITWDMSVPLEVVSEISSVFKNAKSLALRHPASPTSYTDAQKIHYLTKVFGETRNLEELELDITLLRIDLTEFFSSEKVSEVIGNLSSLIIRDFPLKTQGWVGYVCREEEKQERKLRFQRNFQCLSKLHLNLKKFSFGNSKSKTLIYSLHLWGTHTYFDQTYFNFIPHVIYATRNTLEELSLQMVGAWDVEEMMTVHCPKLRILKLSSHSRSFDIAQAFIRNQPPLEHLDVDSPMGIEPIPCFTPSLQGNLGNMKKLHMKGIYAIGDNVPDPWGFLRPLTNMKDFCISMPYTLIPGKDGTAEGIIENLPSTLEKIKISLDVSTTFWLPNSPYAHRDIANLVERFKNLTELNLFRVEGSLNDDGLQNLIRKCPRLTSLAFSDCPQVTDFGISGIRYNEDGEEVENTGVSLLGFTGLTKLKLGSDKITPECFLKVAKFRFLQILYYDSNVKIEEYFLREIVEQNPTLEAVTVRLEFPSDCNKLRRLKNLKRRLNQWNPRVRSLRIL